LLTAWLALLLMATQVPAPCYVAPQLPPAPEEVLPEVEAPQLKEAQLQLQPEPLLVLGWCGGPDDGDNNTADSRAASAAGSASQQQQQQEAKTEGGSTLSASGAGVRSPTGSQAGLRSQQVSEQLTEHYCMVA
jgi:hypothetical protein